ncbi:MAG TPA: ABC transporter permease [Clostridiaceae bacterium]|nr:ABC transporter permease [Clostridiaceae bacterium]
MLSKLLKHEIKDTGRIMPFLYLIAFAATVIAFISFTTGINWLRYSSSVLLILIGIAVFIVTLVFISVRFYQNLYSREGYLMFTLPVKPHFLLVSKAIVSISWLILSSIVTIISTLCALHFLGVFESVSLKEIRNYILQSPYGNLIDAIIPLAVFSVIYLVGQIYFSITLSNIPAFHSMSAVSAIVIFIVLNFALQIIDSIFAVILPISIHISAEGVAFSTQTMLGFLLKNIGNSNLSEMVIGLGGLIFQVIAACILYYFNGWLMNKKVSIR